METMSKLKRQMNLKIKLEKNIYQNTKSWKSSHLYMEKVTTISS